MDAEKRGGPATHEAAPTAFDNTPSVDRPIGFPVDLVHLAAGAS